MAGDWPVCAFRRTEHGVGGGPLRREQGQEASAPFPPTPHRGAREGRAAAEGCAGPPSLHRPGEPAPAPCSLGPGRDPPTCPSLQHMAAPLSVRHPCPKHWGTWSKAEHPHSTVGETKVRPSSCPGPRLASGSCVRHSPHRPGAQDAGVCTVWQTAGCLPPDSWGCSPGVEIRFPA